MPNPVTNHEIESLEQGNLVLVVSSATNSATLLEFLGLSNEKLSDGRLVFCSGSPTTLEPTDYTSLMPPRVRTTGHWKEEDKLRGWRFPISYTDKILVGNSEILSFLENSQGLQPHAAALREIFYQIQRKQGPKLRKSFSEPSEDDQRMTYHCETCGIQFKYGRGEMGLYQFMNCPNSFMTGDPADLRCNKLNSKICPNL